MRRGPIGDLGRGAFAVLCAVLCAYVAHAEGGIGSPAFRVLLLLAFIHASLLRDRIGPAIASAVGIAVSGGVVVWVDAPEAFARWSVAFVAIGIGAVQIARTYRSFFEAAVDAERGRREAAELEARLAREQQEALLRQERSERLAALGSLSAAVAHEINNPLAFVRANLGFIRSEIGARLGGPSAASELFEALDEATAGLDRILQISYDLRAESRDVAEPAEPVALGAVVERALRFAKLRFPSGLRVSLEGVAEAPEVFAERSRLSQVLLNLFSNAGDALLGHPAPELKISAAAHGERVELTIEDNGPGLPEDWERKLFQPFFTTKPEGYGTGLGLALSRKYVEGFGGQLTAAPGPPRRSALRAQPANRRPHVAGSGRLTLSPPRRARCGTCASTARPRPSRPGARS